MLIPTFSFLILQLITTIIRLISLTKDRNRDVVIFMGPKGAGKTELMGAFHRKEFNINRIGTGRGVNTAKGTEASIGVKKFISFDSDGAENNIADYTKRIIEYIDNKESDYLLVILVINIENVRCKDMEIKLAQYLDCIVERIEKSHMRQRYKDGKYAYAIAVTHCSNLTPDQDQLLTRIACKVEKYKGCLRRLDDKKLNCFELSKDSERNNALIWICNNLTLMHGD